MTVNTGTLDDFTGDVLVKIFQGIGSTTSATGFITGKIEKRFIVDEVQVHEFQVFIGVTQYQ